MRLRRSLLIVAALLMLTALAIAQQRERRQPVQRPEPTHANVSYGDHEQQVFDLWLAESEEPTPLVIFIHGGGFVGGSKDSLAPQVIRRYLNAGISVASFEYRFVQHARLPAAHQDCTRALQLLRSRAGEYNLDAGRFGAFGGSAGAQLVMYLAFHDDMADPESDDPIARESTRLLCVATNGGQVTMDFDWWMANIPGYDAPHRPRSEYFAAEGDEFAEIVADISALSLISEDDPPLLMAYAMGPDEPIPDEPGRVQGWQVHHVSHGLALKAAMDELGVEADLHYPGAETKYPGREAFVIEKLTAE